MAIISNTGPADTSLVPAYRPILFEATDDGTDGVVPMVYCDIYFNGTYYKSLSSSSPATTVGIITTWIFDIQALAQEFIGSIIPDITATNLQRITTYGMAHCYVKFRNSTADVYGIITPEPTIPIQATFDTAAVAGTGWQSDAFQLINASLQQYDSQGLEDWLITKKFVAYGPFGVFPAILTTAKIYPLSYQNAGYGLTSHRIDIPYPKAARIYSSDWGRYSIVIKRNGFYGDASHSVKCQLFMYDNGGGVLYSSTIIATAAMFDESIYLIPSGIKNLVALDGAIAALLPTCACYQVGLFDTTANKPIFITPRFYLQDGAAAIPPQHTRIWFQNYLGQLEAITFGENEQTLKVGSGNSERPLTLVPDGFNRSLPGMMRSNVRSNENNAATGQFLEEDMYLLKQLFASAKTYLEFTSPEGVDDPPVALLLPIKIIDGEFTTLTFEDRYEYRTTVKYVMSNENIIVRN